MMEMSSLKKKKNLNGGYFSYQVLVSFHCFMCTLYMYLFGLFFVCPICCIKPHLTFCHICLLSLFLFCSWTHTSLLYFFRLFCLMLPCSVGILTIASFAYIFFNVFKFLCMSTYGRCSFCSFYHLHVIILRAF